MLASKVNKPPITFLTIIIILSIIHVIGYKLNELTPNKTRRAQLVNWLIYYRERLFGKSIAQLQAEALAAKASNATNNSSNRSVTDEVSNTSIPSEVMFERKRLDMA